ncbi:MAG: cytochrome c [Vulcanimicrobiaceae bacterium]
MTLGIRQASVTAVAALALIAGASAFGSSATDAMSKSMMHGKSAKATAATGAVSYSPAQAAAGMKSYGANCASCHGEKLEGGVGPALSGATLNTLAKNTHLTVGDMFTFMSQQMPLNAPASLPKDQYAAIMAYVLKFNGYPAGSKDLTYATATDSKIVMHSK